MSENISELPKDFTVAGYRECNPTLSENIKDDKRIINHYIKHGAQEGRIYKLDLPDDFDVNGYRMFNSDLKEFSDIELKTHFIKNGKKEGRIYKLDLPENFDVDQYEYFNPDLRGLSKECLLKHYVNAGVVEGRKYCDLFFDKSFFCNFNHIKNYQGYKDYTRDIKQIKSQKVKDITDSIVEDKECILLVSHDNSVYGATHYLYLLYEYLTNNGKKVKMLEVDFNPILQKKYNVKEEDILYYNGDSTILYYMCLKINPRKIYFNSMNQPMAVVSKYLNSNQLIIHSHEIKEHYICDRIPDFVVSDRISIQYSTSPKSMRYSTPPKVQPPIILNETFKIMDQELSKDPAIPINIFGNMDTSKITLGMCGNISDRKNYKLFIELASVLPFFNFMWIGGKDLKTSLPNLFHIKETQTPYIYYKLLDYFILTSLQDPCPYVVLENLYVGNKVLTFKDNIYTDHKSDELKDIYFEYDGEINLENAVKHIKNICVEKNTNRSNNKNGKLYILNKFSKFGEPLLKSLYL